MWLLVSKLSRKSKLLKLLCVQLIITNQSKLFKTNAKIIMDPVFLLDRTRLVHQCIVHKTMTAKQANKLKPEAIWPVLSNFVQKQLILHILLWGFVFFWLQNSCNVQKGMHEQGSLASCSNMIVFGFRTTKLQSQKKCHQAVFRVSFLWQRGRTRPKKGGDYHVKKSHLVVFCIDCTRITIKNYKFAIKNMKFAIKNMKFSIKKDKIFY